MRLNFIIAFLCLNLIISLENNEIELGKRIQFDGKDKEFILNNVNGDNNIILCLIEFDHSLKYKTLCGGHGSIIQAEGGTEVEDIFTISEPGTYMCNFTFTGKGNFIIYSFRDTINIDLKDTYGNINLEAKEIKNLNKPYPKLTFTINNLESDMVSYFGYNKKTININDENYNIKNPFTICVNNECQAGDIEEYNFIKNNTYIIIVEIQVITDKNGNKHYVFPGFSFPKKVNYNENKGTLYQLNMRLILMSLILLIF